MLRETYTQILGRLFLDSFWIQIIPSLRTWVSLVHRRRADLRGIARDSAFGSVQVTRSVTFGSSSARGVGTTQIAVATGLSLQVRRSSS